MPVREPQGRELVVWQAIAKSLRIACKQAPTIPSPVLRNPDIGVPTSWEQRAQSLIIGSFLCRYRKRNFGCGLVRRETLDFGIDALLEVFAELDDAIESVSLMLGFPGLEVEYS